MVPILTRRLRVSPLSMRALTRLASGEARASDPCPPASVRADVAASATYSLALGRRDLRQWSWHAPWQLVRRSDGRRIGTIGFAGPPDPQGNVVLGYWLDARYQRRGYMSEAVRAVCRWVLRDARAIRIMASSDAANRASRRVLEKSGFRPYGRWNGHPRWALDRGVTHPLENHAH